MANPVYQIFYDMVPDQDGTLNLGSDLLRFKDIYIAGLLSDGTTTVAVADILAAASPLLLPTETPDGNTTIFTFTQKPSYLFSDGVKLRENHGWTWNEGLLQATLSVPSQYDLWGEKI